MIRGGGTSGLSNQEGRLRGTRPGELDGGNGPSAVHLELPVDRAQVALLLLGKADRVNAVVLGRHKAAQHIAAAILPIGQRRLVGRRFGFARQNLAQGDGQRVKVFVGGGQGNFELLRSANLGLAGDLLGIEVLRARIEEVTDHLVEGFAILALVIVSAGIVIDVPAQRGLATVKLEDRLGCLQQRRQRVGRGEAAVVFGVLGQQGRARARIAVRCV